MLSLLICAPHNWLCLAIHVLVYLAIDFGTKVREYFLNLRLAPSDQRPFFATRQHYLDGFSQNYGIQTELAVEPGVDEGKFDPGAQMQLFRIIEEALSNARKHAGASCVQISFEMPDHHEFGCLEPRPADERVG